MQRTYNLISDAAKAAINTREVGYFGSISVAVETILRHRIDLESAKNACIQVAKMLFEKRQIGLLPDSISNPIWDDMDKELIRPYKPRPN